MQRSRVEKISKSMRLLQQLCSALVQQIGETLLQVVAVKMLKRLASKPIGSPPLKWKITQNQLAKGCIAPQQLKGV